MTKACRIPDTKEKTQHEFVITNRGNARLAGLAGSQATRYVGYFLKKKNQE